MVVDSHIHFWDTRRLRYPWLDDQPALNTTFLQADIDLGSSSVTSTVFVQADCLATQGLAEADWISSTRSGTGFPEIAGIVAFAPLEAPFAAAYLDDVFAIPGVVGVRRLLQDERVSFFENPNFHTSLELVANAGRTFDACVRAWQLPVLITTADRHPGLTIVLDHLGKPPVVAGLSSEEGEGWRRALHELSLRPNVYVKLSGLPAETKAGSLLRTTCPPFLEVAVEYFGVDRCMVGSDWPVSARVPEPRPYDEWFDIVETTVGADSADWDRVSHRTAERAYGLPSDA